MPHLVVCLTFGGCNALLRLHCALYICSVFVSASWRIWLFALHFGSCDALLRLHYASFQGLFHFFMVTLISFQGIMHHFKVFFLFFRVTLTSFLRSFFRYKVTLIRLFLCPVDDAFYLSSYIRGPLAADLCNL
jgi:hypothetical protein